MLLGLPWLTPWQKRKRAETVRDLGRLIPREAESVKVTILPGRKIDQAKSMAYACGSVIPHFSSKIEGWLCQIAGPARRGSQTRRSAAVFLSLLMGKKTHHIPASRNSARRQIRLGNGCRKPGKTCRDGRVSCPPIVLIARSMCIIGCVDEKMASKSRIGEVDTFFESFMRIPPPRIVVTCSHFNSMRNQEGN